MVIALAVAAFVSTNIDDIFILVGFMSDPSYRMRDIIIGQCFGAAVMTLLCFALAMFVTAVFPAYFGLLGIIEIIIGASKLRESPTRRTVGKQPISKPDEYGTRTVAFATIGGFGDNVSIYVPLFAAHSVADAELTLTVFGVMTGLSCFLSYWLVNNRASGYWLRPVGHGLLPWFLIAVGIAVMSHAGMFAPLSVWPLVIALGLALISHAAWWRSLWPGSRWKAP